MTAAAPVLTRRQRAALPGGTRDRLVGLLKWLLPVLAMLVLATIVILPLTKAQEFSFLLAKDKVAMAKERLRIDNAVYRGQTAQGEAFTIAAKGAVQRTSAVPVVELSRLTARLSGGRDGPAVVVAPSGRYMLESDMLMIEGPVRLDSAAGYTVDSPTVAVDLDKRTVAADGAVSGNLPMGAFRANRLRADITGKVLVLDGGAHLRIRRGSGRGAP